VKSNSASSIGKRRQVRAAGTGTGPCGWLFVVNDVSERSYQLERGGQWDKGKGCDTFAADPAVVGTRDEVPDHWR